MPVTFIGRDAELRLLRDAWNSPGSAMIPIYGRRRVGKSELILRFMRQKRGIYFLGKRAPAALQVREFLREAAIVLEEPLLASVPASHWGEALDAVVDRWRGPGKLVIALDEFQWTAGASPELPSLLQERWDRRWKSSGGIFLILCGSYVGFMEREVLGRGSPLFGRRTAQILLRPFGYREAAEFHPEWSLEDRARAYFICGGVPLYLASFARDASIEMNIIRNLLTEYAPLYREPDFLLREELREVENYYAVLLAIASGQNTSSAISAASGVGERALHYYLEQLVGLGYVRRRYPLTGGRPVRRHVRFDLDDPLLRFWFRFVFPHQSYIVQMGPERAMRDLIRPGLDAYFGAAFERLCREALPDLYRREGVTSAWEVGEYWDRSVQIDVVGLRDDDWTDVGECRWGAVPSRPAVERELAERAALYPNARNATIQRRVFVRRAPASGTRAKQGVEGGTRWHTLEDLWA